MSPTVRPTTTQPQRPAATEFIDIFIISQQIAGINYQQTSQVVYASSVWTLFISYGKYDGPILVTPCWERMITSTNILSQFSIHVGAYPHLADRGCRLSIEDNGSEGTKGVE